MTGVAASAGHCLTLVSADRAILRFQPYEELAQYYRSTLDSETLGRCCRQSLKPLSTSVASRVM